MNSTFKNILDFIQDDQKQFYDKNYAIITGRLGADPEIKKIGNNSSICNASIATTYKKNEEEKTTWHKIVIFGAEADHFAKNFKKGQKVAIIGTINHYKYEEKYYTNIVVIDYHSVQYQENLSQNTTQKSSPNQANDGDLLF